jgi:hypothetical protein
MTELLVNRIEKDNSVLLISASPHWSILDLSFDDDVIDLIVKDAVYDDNILDDDIELIVSHYDEVIARLDTEVDVDYFENGGILPYVLRKVLKEI